MSLKNIITLLREAVLGSEQDFTKGSINRAIVLLFMLMILEMVVTLRIDLPDGKHILPLMD